MSGRNSTWTPERDARLTKLRRDGLSVAVIAERFGVRPGTIADRLAALGLTNPRGGK